MSFGVEGVKVQILVEQVDFVSQHFEFLLTSDTGCELDGVHFHVKHLSSQFVQFTHLLIALHHHIVLSPNVDVLDDTEQGTGEQDGKSDKFEAKNMFVAGLFFEDG